MLDIALLGSGGMMPLPNRFLTSLICKYKGRMLLIDCGEGTQVTLKILKYGFKNIDIICITHFHGDHILGLPGLLLTMNNSNREDELTIIGPIGLQKIVESLLIVATEINFKIKYIELEQDNENPIKISGYKILTKGLDHKVDCLGYSIEIDRKGKFNREKAEKNGIPKEYWGKLQSGESIELNNIILKSDTVLGKDRKGLKVTYLTDTNYMDSLKDFAKNSDLLISEGLYGEESKKEKAVEYKHMTFLDSCKIAKDAKVNKLWLTHYSPSLSAPEEYIEMAKRAFPNTELGFDRKEISLMFESEEKNEKINNKLS